jgi:hypothetical protein
MTNLYDAGITSYVRKGTIKISKTNFNANALVGGVENPEDAIILIDRIVADITTAAEAACTLAVGLGDNATDNSLNASKDFLGCNALNIGVAIGPVAAVNYSCKVAAPNANHNATDSWILIGASVIANADSLVADVYVDYIIP